MFITGKRTFVAMERSRWWYALVGIAVHNVIWSLVGVLTGERITVGPATVWVVIGGALFLLTPVFYYALYKETQLIREKDLSWRPDSRVWIGGGTVFSLIGLVMFLNPMTHYVAGLYLVQWFRKLTQSPPKYKTG